MREGVNPVKHSGDKNILKPHRIVVVFYIPDSEEDYFNELDLVLDKCLESIVNTINPNTTNITLINNNSSEKANAIVDKYCKHIDKYVLYNENKGKVYAVLNEVRAVYEPYVTITDADILFYSGWEQAVFDVFNKITNAGVVSPMPLPYLSFHYNKSIFGFNSLLRIQFKKIVEDEDIELYIKGTNLQNIHLRPKNKYSWKERQFIYKKNNFEAVVGAYHVVSTYKTDQFKNINTFPKLKFVNSYESHFIDNLAENKGYYRLSTIKTFAYHIGNKINDDVVKEHRYDITKNIKDEYIKIINKNKKIFIFLNIILARVLIKYYWYKK